MLIVALLHCWLTSTPCRKSWQCSDFFPFYQLCLKPSCKRQKILKLSEKEFLPPTNLTSLQKWGWRNWINCILFILFARLPRHSFPQLFSKSVWTKTEIPFHRKNAITVNLFCWQFGYLLCFIKALKKWIYEEFRATFLLNANNWVKFIAVHSSVLHFSFFTLKDWLR